MKMIFINTRARNKEIGNIVFDICKDPVKLTSKGCLRLDCLSTSQKRKYI